MAEYISRDELLKHLNECKNDPLFDPDMARICFAISVFVKNMKTADVQLLSVVAEHIKHRLYETAFNTNDEIASKTIEDMAERINFWIDELKDGEQNG